MKGRIEQAWANRLKVIRAAIRLKYALEADNALNALIDEERKKFFKQVQQGQLPAPLDPKKVIGG